MMYNDATGKVGLITPDSKSFLRRLPGTITYLVLLVSRTAQSRRVPIILAAFFNQPTCRQRIPQIAVVMGSCTAGYGYADEAIIVKSKALFFSGPPLKAATGEYQQRNGRGMHARQSASLTTTPK